MKSTKLLTGAVAAVVLVSGMVAVGAATPSDVSSVGDHETDPTNASESPDFTVERPDAVGPVDRFSERVPDPVIEVRDGTAAFLDESATSLGASADHLGDRVDDLLVATPFGTLEAGNA